MLIVVVVHVNSHGTHTGMTGIGMVEPVVVISNPVFPSLALHATHRRLTIIPEMVVSYSYIFRITLDIYGTIALGLIGSTTLSTIDSSIITHTLEGHVHGRIAGLTLNLQTLGRA